MQVKTNSLILLGLKNFDALHVASADIADASHFVTCDDRLLAIAKRNQMYIRPRVVNLIECGQEFIK